MSNSDASPRGGSATADSHCTSGCPTQDCGSYAACLRGKRLAPIHLPSTSGVDHDYVKRFDAEIKAYRDATAAGHDPEGSTFQRVREAEAFGEATGLPYTRENVARVQTQMAQA